MENETLDQKCFLTYSLLVSYLVSTFLWPNLRGEVLETLKIKIHINSYIEQLISYFGSFVLSFSSFKSC